MHRWHHNERTGSPTVGGNHNVMLLQWQVSMMPAKVTREKYDTERRSNKMWTPYHVHSKIVQRATFPLDRQICCVFQHVCRQVTKETRASELLQWSRLNSRIQDSLHCGKRKCSWSYAFQIVSWLLNPEPELKLCDGPQKNRNFLHHSTTASCSLCPVGNKPIRITRVWL